jgi:hypothetical protein
MTEEFLRNRTIGSDSEFELEIVMASGQRHSHWFTYVSLRNMGVLTVSIDLEKVSDYERSRLRETDYRAGQIVGGQYAAPFMVVQMCRSGIYHLFTPERWAAQHIMLGVPQYLTATASLNNIRCQVPGDEQTLVTQLLVPTDAIKSVTIIHHSHKFV